VNHTLQNYETILVEKDKCKTS